MSHAFELANQANRFISNIDNVNAMGFTSTDLAIFPPANDGSLAPIAETAGSGNVSIVWDYPWTVSKKKEDTPYIHLIEHKIEGGSIQKQFNFYASGATDAATDLYGKVTGSEEARGILDVYDEIFVPNSTGFNYFFPYFAKASYELTTSQWQQFDSIGQSINNITGGLGKLFGKSGEAVAGAISGGIEAGSAMAQTGLQFAYPVVGIADRPRIFTGHNDRTMTIEFPLYNTLQENDWKRNKDFISLFMHQNLFNKRNFITGLPPCWYKVKIPGVYYSVASCVTNFVAENLGNIRMMDVGNGKEFLVPDAYQVRITLQEMAMPSKNQFQFAMSGENKVESSTVFSGADVSSGPQAAIFGGAMPA
jgi:hypothetical protein